MDKDSTSPNAYDLDLHEALTLGSPMLLSARLTAVCRFMDKYVSGLYGSRSIITWITKNKGKHFLDMVTMSDIAYTVAVIENSYEAWDEEHGIENAGEGQEQEEGLYRRPQKTVRTKFTNRLGKKRQCNMSGWSADGIQFYTKVRDTWRALSQDPGNTTWRMLEEEWATYEDKTNFGHSSRRKKNEEPDPEDDIFYDGGVHYQEHQLWEQFVLLDGDEDFMNERSDKRTRVGDMTSVTSDREDDDESDISLGLEDDEGGRGGSLDVGTVPV